ncbi:MAG: hypothetical protein ABSG86_18645 [Thermoguttaceae bacterium]|jgi:hypothetical protein
MNLPAPPNARARSFRWKIGYLVAMGVLLMPLFWLSHPATRAVGPQGQRGRPGGYLAQLRREYRLNQADIGQIDPTTETIRLTTLGMRGVAGNLLWSKANDYQMKKDWTNLRATLEQISRLQPHSIGVWRYQAWNLSYNVSVAFDDYRDKYYWVMEGIKFMQRGAALNEHESRLVRDIGWFISQKIGRADEADFYRKLFKQDDEFHGSRPPDKRDNWLVGKEWFHEAERRVDPEHPVQGLSDVIFYSDAPMCQFYYAEALEKDGEFGDAAVRAWKEAADEWQKYGDRDMPTSYGVTLRLNDQEMYERQARQAAAELDKLAPGRREKIAREKRAALARAEIAACDTPAEKRTPEQIRLAAQAEPRLAVTHDEVARRVSDAHQRRAALDVAQRATEAEQMAVYVRRERSKVNFDYWRLRARVEQTPQTIAARKAISDGDRAFADADLVAAREDYQRGLKLWRTVLDSFPALQEDINTGDDLMRVIRRYREMLRQADERLPTPFVLQDIIDKYGKRGE